MPIKTGRPVGASNVLAAYALYAGRVPPLSMQLLVYMALVSKDSDRVPWFGMGHAALAVHALGRPDPPTDADLKAVERAVTPLRKVGAITTDRAASVRRDGPSTARYRLNLDYADAPRIPGGVEAGDIDVDAVDIGSQDPQRPPDSGAHAPRNPSPRPPESVPTPPEFRGTEEYEEYEERGEEETTDLRTAVTVARVNGAVQDPQISRSDDRPPARASPGRCERHPAMPAGRCTPCRAQAKPIQSPLLFVAEGAA